MRDNAWRPATCASLLTDGVIAGVGGVVVFLPQILILFFFIGLLEDTGYMARAAFIMDRLMSGVGLHGKSFIPMLSSFACAIPGIMATRTIENPKDRLVTILVAPLMSCSARLPVYALMIAALLPATACPPGTKAGIMLCMYVLGTLGAFVLGLAVQAHAPRGQTDAPADRAAALPPASLAPSSHRMWERAGLPPPRRHGHPRAVHRAVGARHYPKSGNDTPAELAHSIAGRMGHALEPAIEPLGYDWKIGIGLIGSFAAREVFVSTMGVVFTRSGGGAEGGNAEVDPDLTSVRCSVSPDHITSCSARAGRRCSSRWSR